MQRIEQSAKLLPRIARFPCVRIFETGPVFKFTILEFLGVKDNANFHCIVSTGKMSCFEHFNAFQIESTSFLHFRKFRSPSPQIHLCVKLRFSDAFMCFA